MVLPAGRLLNKEDKVDEVKVDQVDEVKVDEAKVKVNKEVEVDEVETVPTLGVEKLTIWSAIVHSAATVDN